MRRSMRAAAIAAWALSVLFAAERSRADEPAQDLEELERDDGVSAGSASESQSEASTISSTGVPFDRGHVALGLGTGIGTPTGYFGGLLALDATPWLELEGGVGTGGAFGRAYAGMVRLQLPVAGVLRFGLGVGLSANFLSDEDRAEGGKYAGAPAKARFLDIEISQDFALGSASFLRFTTGTAILQNGEDFAPMCDRGIFTPSCDPTPNGVAIFNPSGAAARSSQDAKFFMPYFGLEALWNL